MAIDNAGNEFRGVGYGDVNLRHSFSILRCINHNRVFSWSWRESLLKVDNTSL
jgi:hypothetical protein